MWLQIDTYGTLIANLHGGRIDKIEISKDTVAVEVSHNGHVATTNDQMFEAATFSKRSRIEFQNYVYYRCESAGGKYYSDPAYIDGLYGFNSADNCDDPFFHRTFPSVMTDIDRVRDATFMISYFVPLSGTSLLVVHREIVTSVLVGKG